MIGICPPANISFARIAAVASKPSIPGICTSISTTSNWPFSRASNAPRPSLVTFTVYPRFSNTRTTRVWFTGLSSASKTRARCSSSLKVCRVTRGASFAAGAFLMRMTDRFQQFPAVKRLHQIRQDSQFSTASGVTKTTGGRQHHSGHGSQVRGLLDLVSQCETIDLWHLTVQQDQWKQVARTLGDLQCLHRRPPTFDCGGAHSPAL